MTFHQYCLYDSPRDDRARAEEARRLALARKEATRIIEGAIQAHHAATDSEGLTQ